ncbi:carboxy terminal-processing peptidase [soil metagenome]
MSIRTRSLFLLAAPIALSVAILGAHQNASAQSPRGNSLTLGCENVRRIQDKFFDQHILYKAPSPEIEKHAIEQYLKRLDSAKLYLRQSDVDGMKAKMKGLFKQLENDNCSGLTTAYDTLIKRVEERVDFAKKTLSSKDFKFDPNTSITLDPDTRKFAATPAEQNAYQKKYLQFQLSNQLATGLKQDEAVAQVIRTYERGLKRIKETNQEQRFSDYLDSFGRALDPHTSYFSKDALEDFEVQMSLSLEGIGASLSSQDGFTIVEQLIDGGSAKSSGIVHPQDKIVAVGQVKADGTEEQFENVVEMDLREVVRRIRGPKGTKVRLQLLRQKTDGSKERLAVTLTRDKIKLEEDAAQLSMQTREIDGKSVPMAVLNLPSFYSDGKRGGRSAATDMKKLIAEAREKGAKAMVLDFSTNGGGSLDDAVRIAGLFFKIGNVVKQSSNRDPEGPALTLADRDPAVDWPGPLVVVTSRISASASEIVAGTLKDYKRAVIAGGDHTFGKGSVQSVQELPPGLGAVKTTVGYFFTPSGYSTQWRGVTGDIVFPSPFSTDEIGEKSLDYSLQPKRIDEFLSKEAKTTGPEAWTEVTDADLKQLKTRASARVAKNPEFIKIAGEILKAKKRGKIIKLSESLKESKERKDENDSKKTWGKDEKVAEYLKRPELQEALNIAADLYAMQNNVSLNKVTIPPPPPATKVAAVSTKKSVDPVTNTSKAGTPDSAVKGSIKREEPKESVSP